VSIEKPEIDFPGGEPPADLEIKDIWEGDGPVAKAPGDLMPPGAFTHPAGRRTRWPSAG
jgi:hypothetical protein